MINKKTALILFLSLLVVLTCSLHVSAQPDMGPEESLGPANMIYNPSIWENNVVWRNYDSEAELWQIFLGDVITGSAVIISQGPGNKYQPHIQGDRMVWTDQRNSHPMSANPDIYMYDIKKNKETRVTTSDDPNIWEQFPGIYGDYVVWMSHFHGGDKDGIWLRNVQKKSEPIKISSQDRTYYPVIYGDRVVYTDYVHIYIYTISENREEVLDVQPDHRFFFMDLWENKLIWSELLIIEISEGQPIMRFSIKLYDFSRPHQVDIIAENLYSLPLPRISENRIVWSTVPGPNNMNADIYMYDLGPDGIKSGDDSFFAVTTDLSRQAYPDIYDTSHYGIGVSVVAWKDQRNVVPGGSEGELYWRSVFH
jgi:beta propeller repeat protein